MNTNSNKDFNEDIIERNIDTHVIEHLKEDDEHIFMNHYCNRINSSLTNRALDTTNQYRLKLLSDTELVRSSCYIYNYNNLSSSFGLESAIFGQTKTSPCQICGQTTRCTSAHYGLITLPYPVMTNLMLEDHFTKLISIICPYCSNIPLTNARDSLQLNPDNRFKWIVDSVKRMKGVIHTCPYCSNKFSFISVEGTYPRLRYMVRQESNDSYVQLNPLFIYSCLNNISDQVCEYLGFNMQTYNPRNFMTKYMVIIPNKLRIKTLESASSSITSNYTKVVTNIIPELNKYLKTTINTKKIIKQDEQGQLFNQLYDSLNAMYCLFVDMTRPSTTEICLKCIGHRDKKHLDEGSSMVGRLKGKENTYFDKGIIATRHKYSARTVLGGDNTIHCHEIGFPERYCNKMGISIPVYKENLDYIKQFVASMSKIPKHDRHHTRAIRHIKTQQEEQNTIKSDNAIMIASRIQPGDKIVISLLPGSLVMHNRFPSLREESFATHKLVPTQHTIMTLPNAACEYKNADFDGDETQIFVNHGWYTDPESLLLHSIYRQTLDYGNGNLGIFFSCDSKFEVPRFNKDFMLGVTEVHDPISDQVVKRISFYPPKNIIDIINDFIDDITGYSTTSKYCKINKINYSDEKTVIVNNRLNPDKCRMDNMNFYIYLVTTIGSERTLDLIDHLIQAGYNSAVYKPITLGREIRFQHESIKKSIEDYHRKTYEKMKVVEQSDIQGLQKDVEQYTLAEEQKSKIIKELVEDSTNTNLDKIGLLRKFSNEFYKSLINFDPVIIDGRRIGNTLADHTRTCIGFSKYSVDPSAYGYIQHGYLSPDITPTETFYDCMVQRKGMYIKGNGIAEQGYLMKRFIMAFGPSVIDCNGGVCYDNKFISPCYGLSSVNPRYNYFLPLIDIRISRDEFIKKYQSLTNDIVNLTSIRDFIVSARDRYSTVTDFVTQEVIKDQFSSGFNFEQMLLGYPEGCTDKNIIDELITNLEYVFSPIGMKQRWNLLNFKFTEYYFRTKLTKVKISRDDCIRIYYKFLDSLVDAGEPVGMKASIRVSQALAQDALDAIHHASGGSVDVNRVKVTRGSDRFNELLGSAAHNNVVITLGFVDPTEENVRRFALEQETIYFKDLWTKLETRLSYSISDDIKKIHPSIDFNKVNVSKTFIKMVINLNILGDHEIQLSSLFNTLINKFNKIAFISGYVVSSSEFLMYIYFNSNINKIDIDNYIQTWKSTSTTNIIHGKCLVNCYVTKNKNNNEWILQANEVTDAKAMTFNKIILDPRIDVSKCHTSNTKDTNLTTYGVFESRSRLEEEVNYCSNVLSNIGSVLDRHYKTICQGCLASSQYFFAVAHAAMKIEGDYLRRIQFEQPSRFIHRAVEEGKWIDINDCVSSQYYGELPKLGSGYSKIMVYKV